MRRNLIIFSIYGEASAGEKAFCATVEEALDVVVKVQS